MRKGLISLSMLIMLLIALLSFSTAQAQLSLGGSPKSLSKNVGNSIETIIVPDLDIQSFLLEDEIEQQQKDIPYRFGAPLDVDYSLNNSGTWEYLADGSKIWRIRIVSEGAYTINLLFDNYYLPEGSELFIYNEDRSMTIGAFTDQNNKDHRQFATSPVKGDEIIIEYYEPTDVRFSGELTISRIVHGYRDIFGYFADKDSRDFGGSGSCNNNSICPEGDDWRPEIRSVAMVLLSGGSRWCSGSMVNNTLQDQTPYFLTANHCLTGDVENWIIVFKYESPQCSPSVDGPTNFSLQGTTVMASGASSDFALLLLDDQPPDSFNVFYNGWSNEDVESDSAVGIHHPSGDVKKISFDYDTYTSRDYLNENSGSSHWRVSNWEDGTTEGGSSGSPLYNKYHQVIGQLHGGYASCSSITSDWYGKLSLSWDGATPASRLRDWLDPNNSGVTTLAGFDPFAGVLIQHDPLPDTKNSVDDYEVLATITGLAPLDPDSVFLNWRVGLVFYTEVVMTATGTADEYSGFIPAQSPGTVVEYYLEAHATDGDADTTAVFSFRVIDYAVTLDPAELNGSGPSQTDVWYDLSVINDGVLSDSYNLTTSNNIWATTFWDETMTTQISSVGPLAADDTVAIKVKVEIPSTIYGDNDLCNARATSQADGLIFTTTVVRTISAGQPIALPFFDAFTTTVVDPANWVQSSGIAINTVGLSEPSEPNSANLNGDPSGADTLMSQAIDLSGLGGGVNISYHYQQTGGGDSPEASDDLFVEYFNDQGQWTILNQHLGADGDMTVFESYTTGVPLDGYHAAFRLRFRNIATSGSYDDWFVDNIRVDFGPAISASPASYAVTLAADDSTTDQLIIENAGPGGLSYSVNVAPDFGKMNNLFANLYQANETASSRSASPDEWVDYQEPKGGIDFRQGAAVDKNAGGPDGYGYIWIDSDEAGGPSFVWTDISTTGTDITAGLDDDNFVGPFTIGFDFPLYDSSFSEFYVGSNGLIGFGSLTGFGERNNTTIPSGSAPNNMICWCWDDLDITNGSNPNGKVYSELVGSDLVIQYVDYPEYQATAGDVITAQVILSPNGSIKIQYLSIGSSFDTQAATVGIENYTGTDGLQIAFNTAYLHDSLAIEIVKPSQWLFLSGNSGDLLAGESDTLVVNFNSTGLADGVYLSNITINSNDPDPVDNPMLISAELTVDDGPQYICGDADQSTEVDISDAVYLIAYIFSGGPSPDPWQAGDADCSGELDISDAVYLIAFIFNSGPAPCESCI